MSQPHFETYQRPRMSLFPQADSERRLLWIKGFLACQFTLNQFLQMDISTSTMVAISPELLRIILLTR